MAALVTAAPAGAGMPRRASSFVNSVGVNVHMSYFDTSYDHWRRVRSKLVELGVRHVRDGACPGCREQRARLLGLAAAGIRVDYIMGKPGDSLHRMVDMLAGRMRPTVDAVEGPNEYDASGRRRWASLLRSYQHRLYRLVKRTPALAGVPVFGPTLVSGDDFQRLGSLRHWVDFGNVHPYSGGQVPAASLQYNRHAEELVAPRRPVVATEAGFHNAIHSTSGNRPVSEAAQAEYVPRMFLDFFNAGVVRTYLYELLDERPDPSRTDKERHFGLLRHNFSEKPAFRTLKTLLRAVAPVTAAAFPLAPLDYWIEPGAPDDLQQLLLETGPRTYALVLWRNVSVWDTATLRPQHVKAAMVHLVLGAGAAATAVRELGRRHGKPAAGARVGLRLGGMPKVASITR
jgi:hypothetical protein